MNTLPQLLEEDMGELDLALRELLFHSEASLALLIDKGGFLITLCGEDPLALDTTTLAALSAASFAATQGIALLVGETNFSSVYQQGEHHSLLVLNVDEFCLLAIVFQAHLSVGAVKYYAAGTVKQIAGQLKKAHQRAPQFGLDLSLMDLADPAPLFRKQVA